MLQSIRSQSRAVFPYKKTPMESLWFWALRKNSDSPKILKSDMIFGLSR